MKKQDLKQGYCIILNPSTSCLSVESYETARHIRGAQYIKHIDDISMQQAELEKVKDSFKTYRAFENAYKTLDNLLYAENITKEVIKASSKATTILRIKEDYWLYEFEKSRSETAYFLVFLDDLNLYKYKFDIVELPSDSFIGFTTEHKNDYYTICKKLDAATFEEAVGQYDAMLEDCDYHNFRKMAESIDDDTDHETVMELHEAAKLVRWQFLQYLHEAGWSI